MTKLKTRAELAKNAHMHSDNPSIQMVMNHFDGMSDGDARSIFAEQDKKIWPRPALDLSELSELVKEFKLWRL